MDEDAHVTLFKHGCHGVMSKKATSQKQKERGANTALAAPVATPVRPLKARAYTVEDKVNYL